MTPTGSIRVVDADGHVTEPEDIWAEYLPAKLRDRAPHTVRDDHGHLRNVLDGVMLPAIPRKPEWTAPGRTTGGRHPNVRLADLDAEGIAQAVCFPTTGLFFAGLADPALETALCHAYNSWLADYASTDPARLVGVAMVPQHDLDAALVEARRAVGDLGFRAIMLRPNPVDDRTLLDPAYEPLWTLAAEMDAPIAIHEGTTQNLVQSGDRFDDFAYRHACSHPHEQQMACMSFTCGGILERHPSLRVVFLESGCGWIAWWLERLDEHMEEWDHATTVPPLQPSEYFARQCFISTEPDEKTLPAVISMIGADSIVFASDYPHPDAIFPGAVRALAERTDVAAADLHKILDANARRCFGL